ncbi:MAG: TonB-dependent receptor plug domain-containing protein [Bacteroidales bacterium]|nr:TonB-dependent receptor plug domain-containing protein [Bacteroidales bacterium]
MNRGFYIMVLLMFPAFSLIAQDTIRVGDEVTSLEGITVKATKIRKMSGYKKTRIDSTALEQYSTSSFSELLSRHSPMFIKSYGQGALATASFRGTSASHTKVLWNGVEISSPMLGQTDFSMIPVFAADKVSLRHGGGSISKGSGGLGGSISIKNEIDWSENFRMKLEQRFGSFDTYKTNASLKIGNSEFQSRTRLHYATSDNDFSFKNNFKNRNDPPVEVRENAGYSQTSLLQEMYWKLGPDDVVTLHVWGQNHHRNIAPPLGVNASSRDEEQENSFLRSIVHWKKQLKSSTLSVRTAYLYDYLNYKNDIARIDSDNYSYRMVSAVKYQKPLTPKLTLETSMKHQRTRVRSNNYEGQKQRNRITAFAGLEYTFSKRLVSRLMLRQQWIDGSLIPVIPSVGMDYKVLANRDLFVKANLSRNYRLPTMNDLYWSPGGNSALEPERGISWELGAEYSQKITNDFKIETEVTGFRSAIDDWISWSPDSVMSYWTPRNLKSVVSKGVENSISVTWQQGTTELMTRASYNFTRTYNKSKAKENETNNQLIYVPQHTFSSYTFLKYKKWYADITYCYTGKRYTTPENDAFMPAFSITDAGLGYHFQQDDFKGELSFKVNNLFDTDYQVMAWHPMPGRNYHFSLKINLFDL